MRKTCVLWAKPVLALLTIIIAAGVYWSDSPLSAQSPDPLTLPRVAFSDLIYLGGFRLPNTAQGGDFSYGGNQMAYNPARNSLFVSSLHYKVAEVTIPAPVNTTDTTRMSFASYLQPFSDPSEGRLDDIGAGTVMGGLLVHGDRLYATGWMYYDALMTQVVSHFSHSTNLSEPSFRGMSQVWETGKAGFVGGYMANVPAQWQSLLGGPAITGQCCIPIVTRTSFGPAAFGFDPAGIGGNTALPASPLLYYTKEHATLGPWEGASALYGGATMMGGAAVIEGTRTALFIGRIGTTYCYGYGVEDPALNGTRGAENQTNCYDPWDLTKGTHGYPYLYQIWAYDLADLAAVKAGAKQPWDVVPYGVWPIEFPTLAKNIQIGGIAYDAQRQLLYVSQKFADLEGCCERRPVIHTLKINVPSSSAPLPLSPAVSLTPDAVAPQSKGTLIRWSAAVTGPAATYEYKWSARANGVWSVLQDWPASPTLDWQPATAASDARIAVSVRSAGGAASAEYPFPIVEAGTGGASFPASSLTLTTNLPAPQPAASTIVWTATATGGTGAMVYKWFVYELGLWRPVGSWTASNQFSWTPANANADYRVSAWVKSAAKAADERDASAERPFAITAVASAPAPAPAPTASRVASLALSTNVPAPQPAASTIIWTATPTGGSTALLYKWFVYDLGLWRPVGSWTASNQFSWTPANANANYRVSAWVKSAATAADEAEATTERPFAITAAAGSAPAPAPTSTSTRVASLALTTNVPAPQPAASTIVWTATPTGGTGTLVYKWFVYDLGLWRPMGSWTASNQFSWTPTKANLDYRVSAWVKNAATAADEAEATTERPFAITAATSTPAPPPAPASSSTRVTSLALTTNVPAPQPAGSTVVWTAMPTGGSAALVYKWFVYDLGLWRPVGSWTASNQFSWTPTNAKPDYRVSAWVKSAATAADEAEATTERPFAITAAGSAPAPTPASSATRATSLALTTNVPAPQPAGSTVVWTATPTGGSAALLYKWFVYDLGLWRPVGSWTASNQFSWTPANANASYKVSAWVKSAATAADEAEATTERPFAITAAGSAPAPTPASSSTRVTSLALTTNVPAPQPAGSTIVWTATPTGGSAALLYKWFVYDLGLWRPVGSWTASNQFSWTPANANASYKVSAWVKSAATAADEAEATTERPFAITAAGSAPAPTPASSSTRVTSLALTTNVPAPQPAGSTIVWTATPTGGSAALLYKWFVYDLGLWRPVGSWTASNQFSWTPTNAKPDYRVSAWVKSAATAADEAEATTERPFAITAATSALAPAPAPTSARVASLALTTNVPAPQLAGSTIVWTATPSGGSAALVYKWFVYDLGLWRPVGSWTASNQFSWTPANANASYKVSAWVKSAATAADEAEATTERPFAITAATSAPAPTSARVASLTLTTNVPAPQPAGSTIVWTATPTGGSAALLYKWFVYQLGVWRPVGSWTTSSQFSWTPANANADYRVSAWVKSAATAADEAEATTERPFAITTP